MYICYYNDLLVYIFVVLNKYNQAFIKHLFSIIRK